MLILLVFLSTIANSFGQMQVNLAYRHDNFDCYFRTESDLLIIGENDWHTIFYVPKFKFHYYWPMEYFTLSETFIENIDTSYTYKVTGDKFLRIQLPFHNSTKKTQTDDKLSPIYDKETPKKDTLNVLYDFVLQNSRTKKNANKAILFTDYGKSPRWNRVNESVEISNVKRHFKENRRFVSDALKQQSALSSNVVEGKVDLKLIENNRIVALNNNKTNVIFIAEDTNGRVIINCKVLNGKMMYPSLLNEYEEIEMVFKHKNDFYIFKNLNISNINNMSAIKIIKNDIPQQSIVPSAQRGSSDVENVKTLECIIDAPSGTYKTIVKYDKLDEDMKASEIIQLFLKNNSNFPLLD